MTRGCPKVIPHELLLNIPEGKAGSWIRYSVKGLSASRCGGLCCFAKRILAVELLVWKALALAYPLIALPLIFKSSDFYKSFSGLLRSTRMPSKSAMPFPELTDAAQPLNLFHAPFLSFAFP